MGSCYFCSAITFTSWDMYKEPWRMRPKVHLAQCLIPTMARQMLLGRTHDRSIVPSCCWFPAMESQRCIASDPGGSVPTKRVLWIVLWMVVCSLMISHHWEQHYQHPSPVECEGFDTHFNIDGIFEVGLSQQLKKLWIHAELSKLLLCCDSIKGGRLTFDCCSPIQLTWSCRESVPQQQQQLPEVLAW